MENLAGRQMALLRERFSEPIDLMGISTGGAIALQLAVDYPSAIRRLVVVAAASWLGNVGRRKLRQYGDQIAQGRSGASILASVLAPTWLAWLAVLAIWIRARSERRIDAADMLATIDAECGFDVTARSGAIRAATLVIAGDRDRAFSPELFSATATGIPGARLVVYSGRGHLGTMFDSRFGRDVAAFLDESTAPFGN
jgi:pimeloyl-ACP methyl ester carboxylesterase